MSFGYTCDQVIIELMKLMNSNESSNKKMSKELFSPPLCRLVVYPPPPAKGGITITEEDLSCLEEGEFLNDVIIDFYLRYLVCEELEKEHASKYHVFSSFFFKCLTQKDHSRLPGTTRLSIQEHRHSRVKTWTRMINLFDKDFIFVPMNQI
ncbi:sentrin-specific protease 6-like [Cyprinus carpio]|uniref:Sentrin-specific protease 6-like n=1 Tax=Cyprinus carpio TaxID=7962 RepID=A0A9Q9YZM6_CYPCA|nr:sentrin-specific protease 6-like [Cyprinus carpio]